jgi:predicted neuraminidase
LADFIFSSETHWLISKRDNGKSYLSFNSLDKICYLSFNRGEHFLEINQSETRIACGCQASMEGAL